jgi:hypothetical protein
MIRGLRGVGAADDLAGAQAIREACRHERVVQPHVRAPRRERVAGDVRMQRAESVQIAAVEDRLDRPPADRPAAQPHERTQAAGQLPHVKNLPGCERVEVPDQQVRPVLMARDARQQRAQLELPAAFRPRGMHGAQPRGRRTPSA